MPMKRIPPPGSHPGGGPGPAGTPCTERLHVARRTSSTIHIHPPRRSTPACDGRTRGRPAHKRSVTDMAKCVSPGVPVHGGDNKPDHANLGAVGRKLTGEQRAPSLGRSGGVGPLCVNFPSARVTCPGLFTALRWNFGSAKSTKHTGCLPTTRRSMIWHGSMVFEFSSLD